MNPRAYLIPPLVIAGVVAGVAIFWFADGYWRLINWARAQVDE